MFLSIYFFSSQVYIYGRPKLLFTNYRYGSNENCGTEYNTLFLYLKIKL